MLLSHILSQTRAFLKSQGGYLALGLCVSASVGFAAYGLTTSLSYLNAPAAPAAAARQVLRSDKPPVTIDIPKIKKNLPVRPATVRGNDWDLFDDAVAWLSTSATPGKGNVILYAHDWENLWADIYRLVPGDEILLFADGIWMPYTVTESRLVDEHDVASILSDKNRLTLYTCEGTFDDKRRVVYADPK